MASLECHDNPKLPSGYWVSLGWGCRPGRVDVVVLLDDLGAAMLPQNSGAYLHSTRHQEHDGTVLNFLFPNSALAADSRDFSHLGVASSPFVHDRVFFILSLFYIRTFLPDWEIVQGSVPSRSGEQDKIVSMGRALKPSHFCHLHRSAVRHRRRVLTLKTSFSLSL